MKMKNIQRNSITALSFFIAAWGLAGCQGSDYTVVGDNKKEIERHAASHDQAKAYLVQTHVTVTGIRDMNALPVGAALEAQNKTVLDLQADGDKLFGGFALLSHCRNLGEKTQAYWSAMVTRTGADAALAAYIQEAQGCEAQMNTAPQPVTFVETAVDKPAPAQNCVKMASDTAAQKVQQWSCPAAQITRK